MLILKNMTNNALHIIHRFFNNIVINYISLLKSAVTVFNLFAAILYTSAFQLAKFDFSEKLEVSIPVAFLNLI